MTYYNRLPLWLRVLILFGGCAAIFFYSYHIQSKQIIKEKKNIEKQIQKISQVTSLIKNARDDHDTLIFEKQLMDPHEMRTFLKTITKEIPGISLSQISYPKKKNLVEYLHEKEVIKKKRRGRRRSKNKRTHTQLPKNITERLKTIEKISNLLKIDTKDLMAQKIHIELQGSYEGVVRYIKKISTLQDILWNKIEYNVEKYPTAHVTLKLYAITKKG